MTKIAYSPALDVGAAGIVELETGGMEVGKLFFRQAGLTVIGLTGGIASGKSTVAALVHELLGGGLLSADQVCRELLEPRQPGWLALAAEFGDIYFRSGDGTLDRPKLRHDLFTDDGLRRRLDGCLHPLVKQGLADRLAALGPGLRYCLIEVPLLFEAGWENEFDVVVVVNADQGSCLERLRRRDKVSGAEARAALTAQWPLRDKVARADYVVDNSGDLAATREKVAALVRWLISRAVRAPGKKS